VALYPAFQQLSTSHSALAANVAEIATITAGTSAPSPSRQPPGCGALLAGQMLDAGQSLSSCNGEYSLNMQGDGNLVLRTSSGSAVWYSATSGHDGAYLVVQNGGDVVIYAASSTELWYSATDGK
jgi:hypothetical protein